MAKNENYHPFSDVKNHGFFVVLGGADRHKAIPVEWCQDDSLLYKLENDDTVRRALPGHWGRYEFDAAAGRESPNFSPKRRAAATRAA